MLADWAGFCNHVVKIENKYCEKEGIVEDAVDSMVISLGRDDYDKKKVISVRYIRTTSPIGLIFYK